MGGSLGWNAIGLGSCGVPRRSAVRSCMSEEAEVRTVPIHFLCPISMEVMQDPVTLTSGHTYDRQNIEKWFRAGHNTCPQTRQLVRTKDLVPNLTLKKYLVDWMKGQLHNASLDFNGDGELNGDGEGQARSSETPTRTSETYTFKQVLVTRADVYSMLQYLELHPCAAGVKNIVDLAKENERNRILIKEAHALVIIGIVLIRGRGKQDFEAQRSWSLREQALSALIDLSICSEPHRALLMEIVMAGLHILPWFLHNGSSQAISHSLQLIECLTKELEEEVLLKLGQACGLITGLVGQVRKRERVHPNVLRSSLRSLHAICLAEENRSRAGEAGAVDGLIELLAGASVEAAEGALAILSLLSSNQQARSNLRSHAFGVALLVSSLVIFSPSATEHAMETLHAMLLPSGQEVDLDLRDQVITIGGVAKLTAISQAKKTKLELRQSAHELLEILLPNGGYSHSRLRSFWGAWVG